MDEKVFICDSNIRGIGKGLFAKVFIKAGSFITEFKGILRNSGNITTDHRSNLSFEDGTTLECDPNNSASYANDVIDFPSEPRYLLKSLLLDKPFYKKHANCKINSRIEGYQNSHRAYLMATMDIEAGEEIYCHYGFKYWMSHELKLGRFIDLDKELENNSKPQVIFNYPAFNAYINEFYPEAVKYEHLKQNNDTYILSICVEDGGTITCTFPYLLL